MGTSDTMHDGLIIDLNDIVSHEFDITSLDSNLTVDTSSIVLSNAATARVGIIETDGEFIVSDKYGEVNYSHTIRELIGTVEILSDIIQEIVPGLDIKRRLEQRKMIDKLSGNETV
jgi:hypothetical protein